LIARRAVGPGACTDDEVVAPMMLEAAGTVHPLSRRLKDLRGTLLTKAAIASMVSCLETGGDVI